MRDFNSRRLFIFVFLLLVLALDARAQELRHQADLVFLEGLDVPPDTLAKALLYIDQKGHSRVLSRTGHRIIIIIVPENGALLFVREDDIVRSVPCATVLEWLKKF